MQDVIKEGLGGSIIKIDEKVVTNHLNEIVLETVEQTLNGRCSPWKAKRRRIDAGSRSIFCETSPRSAREKHTTRRKAI